MSNKMSRRNFLKTTGAVLGATAFGGLQVGSNPLALGATRAAAQSKDLSMMLWGSFIPTNNPLLESLVQDWAKRNDTSLELTFTGFGQLSDTIATAAATGDGPDLISMLYIRPHQFAESLVDITDVAEEVGEANGGWFDVAREACEVDGVWRALPFFATAHAMVYREDLFAEAGYDTFPETWDDLLVAGTALKEMGSPLGFSFGRAEGDGNNFLISLLWSFGARINAEDGSIALDSPETRQALEFAKQLYNDTMDPSVIEWDDGANNRAYLSGDVSCTNNASSILWAGRNQGIDFMAATNHAPYPAGPGGRVQLTQIVSIGIMDYVEDVDAAKDLLRYIGSQQVWLPLGVDGFAFYYPVFRGLEENPAMPWNYDTKLGAFKGLMETGHVFGWPGTPSAEASEVAVNFVLVDMFARVAADTATVDESIQQAIEQINDIYGN